MTPMTARVLRSLARRVPAVVLSAFAAHAVVYHGFWPPDGAHGYFAWYAPFVTVLSAVSILGLPFLIAIALVGGRESRSVNAARSLLPRSSAGGLVGEAVGLASGALVFLVAQESLEHSLQLHRLALAGFTPAAWLFVLAAVVSISWLVSWVGRAVSSWVDGLCRDRRSAVSRQIVTRRLSGTVPHRSRPLAVHGALRAPPARI